MPGRKHLLINNNIYHIYNRGVAKQNVFFNSNDYKRFIKLINYYRFTNASIRYSMLNNLESAQQQNILNNLIKKNQLNVQIITFKLMPNHYHFILKQISKSGIAKFMANITNSYAKYINIKNDRVGPLFQGRFKALPIKSEEQLLHLSRYQHLNIYSEGLVKKVEDLFNYPYSSLPNYIGNSLYSFIDNKIILSYFKNHSAYKKFMLNNTDYQRSLAKLKRLTLEKYYKV